ncbi:ATP synthase subunit b [Candidatus Mycoplasma haematolamae str. Purdue]|uniref:ATP synthase subunit b n=1 Tax=Mycoplasma haematolamae (strain Purdue) TaxID=1212765 RepID=I7B9A9_MYCHA|nr:ATP synthase subunit b [Candidatus Mycoplasma haematolamae str. Purdue]
MKLFTAPQPAVIVAHILSSIFVLIFIVYFFWKPTNQFINDQKKKLDQVHDKLAVATKQTKTALNNLQVEQVKLVKTRERLLAERQEQEDSIREKVMAEAEAEKGRIIAEAERKARIIEEETKKTVNEKIVSLSVGLAEKLIKGAINEKTQSRIIDGYLDEIDNVFHKPKEELAAMSK